MRVLVAAGPFGDLDPVLACEAVGAGWARRAPQVQVVAVPQSDGGSGFLAAVGASRTDLEDVLVRGVPALRAGSEIAYLAGPGADPAAEGVRLGAATGELADQGVERIVIGVGESPDAGLGPAFLEGLSGGDIRAARERLAQVGLTAAVSNSRELLGLQGACAESVDLFAVDPQTAQENERAMGEWAAQVEVGLPTRTELLTGKPRRLSKEPGAGAGAGLGFAVAAAGGHLRSGAAFVAELSGLTDQAAGCAVAVTAAATYDWRQLHDAVPEQVSHAAAHSAVPAIVLARAVEVGRRETMAAGFSGCYSLQPDAHAGPYAAPAVADDDRAGLERLAARVAGTWTPRR